ncbi:hypothetical protein VA596_22570 [Amycolatopsis sp., V23-08]|uniref:Uncharacterized protein n=1 Tax=Amycolatopsis heterodermiae TaxID=3110235 RepID=A0ABU5R962_9PSEU|nr:hypothetical protein [Amycolatopsis sp., V23-08]MEA5362339.1 hypothetical protein [Amycolatopsis sp., V23-08]
MKAVAFTVLLTTGLVWLGLGGAALLADAVTEALTTGMAGAR